VPIATKEPSDSALGKLARQGTDEYRGLVLACLVAADWYYHLEHDIRPALRAGYVVICDRYVPTSLVLQRIDGVEPAFLSQVNQYADKPDLTVVLTGEPRQCTRYVRRAMPYSTTRSGMSRPRRWAAVVLRAVLERLGNAQADVNAARTKES
jgi:dTMP kinase